MILSLSLSGFPHFFEILIPGFFLVFKKNPGYKTCRILKTLLLNFSLLFKGLTFIFSVLVGISDGHDQIHDFLLAAESALIIQKITMPMNVNISATFRLVAISDYI